MAEDIVGVVKDRLLSLLREEASLLRDVAKEVAEIANELEDIHSVLKDAEKKAETEGDDVSYGVKAWVQELREVAFEVEDVVTEYTHHMERRQPYPYQWGSHEFLRQIAYFFFFFCSRLKRRHDLAWQIQDIKVRLIRIHERSKTYGFINSIQQGSTSSDTLNVVTSYDPRRSSRYIHEDQLVGIESARDSLVGVLLGESSQRMVIPVVGMGGLGKTTLVQQVYNHVQGRFLCHAWVQVPRPYRRDEILRTLISELFESTKSFVPCEVDTMDEGKLTNKLRQILKQKRYLVIFDDVWKEDFWGDIEHALVDDNVGGRIMITTRNMHVAEFCRTLSSVHIHQMQPLPLEKAWELFCKKTFRSEGCCPKELEKFSGEIVERCEGLPLAIVVIAGLLSTKYKTINVWRKFHASLSSELENNGQLASITKILLLSYNELPYYLKSCLLYFGMFPRRHSIKCGRLTRQWIARGFVKAAEDKTSEEVAKEYMHELINRSLVEASSLGVTGKVKECCVHDLFHDIILKKAKEASLCRVFLGSTKSEFRGIARSLSIMINSSNDDLQGNKFPHAHSVIVFREDEALNSVVPVFVTNFKFLKVLDFEDAPRLDHLPEDIGNLFDLRYLSVQGTKVKTLPWSMEKLENLETLDLRKSLVDNIPADLINRLSKLRNLYAQRIERADMRPFRVALQGIKVVGGIGRLKFLQKLFYIEADGEGVDVLFKELSNLTQLRSLGIVRLRNEDGRALCGCIEKMEQLESLIIASTSEKEFIDLTCISSPPQFLERLHLRGCLWKLPEWFAQLRNIVKIKLAYSMLEDDPLEVLQNMHGLLQLCIYHDSYVGEQLHFKKGVFPRLKQLFLSDLSRLRSLIIEETALPDLEDLYIGPCPQMKKLPSGLQHLKNLKDIFFNKMPTELMTSQDFHIVLHVPRIIFCFIDDQGLDEFVILPRPQILDFMQEIKEEQEQAGMSGVL